MEEDGLGDIVFCFDGMKGCSAEVKVGYLARTLVPQAFGVSEVTFLCTCFTQTSLHESDFSSFSQIQ